MRIETKEIRAIVLIQRVIMDIGGFMKATPGELRDVAFPECYKECRSTEFFGVSECGVFCPEKFTNFGESPNNTIEQV